jgi:hypothetical protein
MKSIPLPFVILGSLLLLPALLQSLPAQVNTEAMRRTDVTEGLSNRIDFGLQYNAGNTRFLDLNLSGRSDYLSGDWYVFLAGNYERSLQDTLLFTNKGFLHLRGSYGLTTALRVEAFVQKEFNDYIQLQDRRLAGGGLRIAAIKTPPADDSTSAAAVYAGVGGMWEREVTTGSDGGVTSLARSTNYLSVSLQLNRQASLSATGYYQPAFRDLSDYRILVESNLDFRITQLVAWTTKTHYRFDSQPPAGLKRFDLELDNGVSLTF